MLIKESGRWDLLSLNSAGAIPAGNLDNGGFCTGLGSVYAKGDIDLLEIGVSELEGTLTQKQDLVCAVVKDGSYLLGINIGSTIKVNQSGSNE